MERIIVDSYIKGAKQIWGDDPNDAFNQKILAVNEMYGWLYVQGILKAASFEFKDYSFGTCFALDVNDLVPYRGAMEAARVDHADLAVRHIFDEPYTPCQYSGAITLSSPMASYRDVDGCVGRSWECSLAQGLDMKALNRVVEARNGEGIVAAVKATFAEFQWKESDLEKEGEQSFMNIYEKLCERVCEEREAFRREYQGKPSMEVYSDWYKISFHEAFFQMLTCDWLSDQEMDREAGYLADMERPVGFLYAEYLKREGEMSFDWDDMVDLLLNICTERMIEAQSSLEDAIQNVEGGKSVDEIDARSIKGLER